MIYGKLKNPEMVCPSQLTYTSVPVHFLKATATRQIIQLYAINSNICNGGQIQLLAEISGHSYYKSQTQ